MSDNLVMTIGIVGTDDASAAFRAADASLTRLVATLKAAEAQMRTLGTAWATSLDEIAASAKASTTSAAGSIERLRETIAADAAAIERSLTGTFLPLAEGATTSTASTIAKFSEMRAAIGAEIDTMRAGLVSAFAPLSEGMAVASEGVVAGARSMQGALDGVLASARATAAELKAMQMPAGRIATQAEGSAAATTAGAAAGSGALAAIGLNPLTAIIGAGAYGAYARTTQLHEAAKAAESGLRPEDVGMTRDQFLARVQADASAVGETADEVLKAYAASARLLQGVDPRERFELLSKVLRPAEFESQTKGVPLSSAMSSILELGHQLGEYHPDALVKLAQEFSAASLATKASLEEITNTSSYFLPQLHASLGLDAPTGLSMMLAGKNAGLASTKAGTNLRAFEEGIFATGKSKHDDELKRLGLLGSDGKPTWMISGKDGRTDWLASNLRAGEILQSSIGALPEDERLKALKDSLGEQGGRIGSLMATPAFRDQVRGIYGSITKGSEGDQLGRLQAEDPAQQFRQAWSDFKTVAADIGTMTLPPVVAGLKALDEVLKVIHSGFGWVQEFLDGFKNDAGKDLPSMPDRWRQMQGGGLKKNTADVEWDNERGGGSDAGGTGFSTALRIWAQQAIDLAAIRTAIVGPELTALRSIDSNITIMGQGLAAMAGQIMGGVTGTANGITNASFEGAGIGGGGSGGPSVGHAFSAAAREANIRHFAAINGINPDIAMRVARSEGFGKFMGDHGTSFGDLQMHIGGGLGDLYRKATGKNPADPQNELDLDRFALEQARKSGWSAWHGAARVGIFGRTGMGYKGPIPSASPAEMAAKVQGAGSPRGGATVHAPIHVNGAGDPEKVAEAVKKHIDRTINRASHDVYFDV